MRGYSPNIYVASIDKLRKRILNNQDDVIIGDLVKFMESYGFAYRVGSRGHYIFRKEDKRVGVAVYVKDCIKAVEDK